MEQRAFSKAKIIIIIVTSIVGLLAIAILGIMFLCPLGQVKTNQKDFTIKSAFTINVTIKYSEITDIDLVNEIDEGEMVTGLNIRKYKSGSFINDEFGNYTLCIRNNLTKFIIVEYDDKILVFNYNNDEETISLYDELVVKMGE